MTTQTFGEVFEELRVALEAKQRVHAGVPDFEGDTPDKLVTQYMEPDPQYARLLALVRRECPGVAAQAKYDAMQQLTLPESYESGLHSRTPCALGCTNGYITRTADWEEAPEGALEGAFLFALERYWDAMAVPRSISRGAGILRMPISTGNKILAVEALLAWVKETP